MNFCCIKDIDRAGKFGLAVLCFYFILILMSGPALAQEEKGVVLYDEGYNDGQAKAWNLGWRSWGGIEKPPESKNDQQGEDREERFHAAS